MVYDSDDYLNEQYIYDDVLNYVQTNKLDVDMEDFDEVKRLLKTIPLMEEEKSMKLSQAVLHRAVARRDKINRLKGKDNSRDKQKDKYRSDVRKRLVDAIRASKTQLFLL